MAALGGAASLGTAGLGVAGLGAADLGTVGSVLTASVSLVSGSASGMVSGFVTSTAFAFSLSFFFMLKARLTFLTMPLSGFSADLAPLDDEGTTGDCGALDAEGVTGSSMSSLMEAYRKLK